MLLNASRNEVASSHGAVAEMLGGPCTSLYATARQRLDEFKASDALIGLLPQAATNGPTIAMPLGPKRMLAGAARASASVSEPVAHSLNAAGHGGQHHKKAPRPSFPAELRRCTGEHKQTKKQPQHEKQPGPEEEQSRYTTKPPAAAFIFAGHARTFILSTVHEAMLKNAVLSFEADAYNFFVLSADDPGSTKGNIPIRSDYEIVRAAVQRLNPVAFIYETADDPILNATPSVPSDCVLNNVVQVGDGYHRVVAQTWWLGWWQTWRKLSRAFGLVQNYEMSHAPWQFDWVVRLRPDAWFFSPGFAYCDADPSKGIHTPGGVAGCGGGRCVNDHLAWVPRKWADSYFMGATPLLENCHGRAFLDSMKDYGYHLRYRLEQQHVPFADARLVPYTIVRACSIRSNGSTTIGSAAPACQRVTMNNIFVQGHPGFERLRNPVADQWRREMFSECLKRWPSWPRGIGAECPTVHGDHVG